MLLDGEIRQIPNTGGEGTDDVLERVANELRRLLVTLPGGIDVGLLCGPSSFVLLTVPGCGARHPLMLRRPTLDQTLGPFKLRGNSGMAPLLRAEIRVLQKGLERFRALRT